jgi:TldD protein
VISDGLERHAALFQGHTELRVQENRSTVITLVNGDCAANAAEVSAGCSARVWRAGSWGFASRPGMDDESLAAAAREAAANARFLADRRRPVRGMLPLSARSGFHDLSTDKPRRTRAELLDFIRAIDARLAEKHPGLASRTLSLRCLDMEKVILTSEGASAGSLIPRSNLVVELTIAAAGGDVVELRKGYGGLGQFEDVFSDPETLFPALDDLCERLRRKAEGVRPEAGVRDVVLAPDLAGILAHEAVGHVAEGDLVLGGSVARDRLGQEVASPLVTIVDFARTAMGAPCPVPVWTDDEGSAAEDVVIVDRGVLRAFMHGKETALMIDAAPTGNARAFAFSDEPLVRMRNTAILPGSSRLEEMLASVPSGYYLMSPRNGEADTTSEFTFAVSQGYEIKDGKLGRALRDTTVSGVAFEMLKTVSMVSGDMDWSSWGMCGKKQSIPVGLGGPAIKCRLMVGGR